MVAAIVDAHKMLLENKRTDLVVIVDAQLDIHDKIITFTDVVHEMS